MFRWWPWKPKTKPSPVDAILARQQVICPRCRGPVLLTRHPRPTYAHFLFQCRCMTSDTMPPSEGRFVDERRYC